jgi:hypothetical protein
MWLSPMQLTKADANPVCGMFGFLELQVEHTIKLHSTSMLTIKEKHTC